MKRRPYSAIRNPKSRRIPCRNTEELKTSYESYGRSTEEYEMTIQQEKVESSRTQGWRQHVVGKQEYPFKSTLKEVG